MQSAQESLAELRAAIRYCENAISAAESTIESIDFRQQLAKQQAMNKQESTGREVALEAENAKLREEVDKLRKEKEASSGPCGCQAYRDLEEKVADLKEQPKMDTNATNRLREDIDILILENTKLKLEQKDLNFDNAQLQEANDHLEACVAELQLELEQNKTNVADSNI
jgi:chromosome segregation ATPase